MHKFGKFISFKNLLGGDKALDMYLSWIYDETNFDNEKNNIKIYRTDENNTVWLTSDGTEIEINPLKYNLDGTGRKQAILFERKYRLAFFLIVMSMR